VNSSTLALGFAVIFTAAPALADGVSAGTTTSTEATAEDAPAAIAKAQPEESATAKTAEPTVMLHVKSRDVAVPIEREDTGEVVCTSPCDKPVPATVRYRIGGYRPSDAFTLDAHGGEAALEVEAATKRGFLSGSLVLGAGASLALGGIVTLALGYASQDPVPGVDGTVTDTTYSDTMIVGTTLVVAGVASGIWGGATLASNLQTRVTGNIVKAPPARGTAQPPRTAALEDSTVGRRANPIWSAGPTFIVPILKRAF
jgi:hypothetical protein